LAAQEEQQVRGVEQVQEQVAAQAQVQVEE
jgi:hypothetical protein